MAGADGWASAEESDVVAPAWLRAVAVVASLVGLSAEEAAVGFAPADGMSIARAAGSMLVPGERVASAQRIARERTRLVAARPAGPAPAEVGPAGEAVATLLRGIAAGERAALVRAFEPSVLRAAARVALPDRAMDTHGAATLVALAARELGAGLGAAELSELCACAALGDRLGAPTFVTRALRAARVAGLDPAAAVEPVWAVFARRGSAGQE